VAGTTDKVRWILWLNVKCAMEPMEPKELCRSRQGKTDDDPANIFSAYRSSSGRLICTGHTSFVEPIGEVDFNDCFIVKKIDGKIDVI
jgi:hypothetical protein